jgi:pimeloyl-ACP methyl ester carboxylesterase
VVVPGTGHLLTEQDPTAVVEAVATVATRCRTA